MTQHPFTCTRTPFPSFRGPQEALRARNDLQAKLAVTTADLNDTRSELRVSNELHRTAQSSLDEARSLLAVLREEKTSLASRVGRAEATAHATMVDSESVEAERNAASRELTRLSRANESLVGQLEAANREVERLRAKAASVAVAADVAHYRRSASGSAGGSASGGARDRDAYASPLADRHTPGASGRDDRGVGIGTTAASSSAAAGDTPATMLRIEHGDVIIGDGVQSVTRGRDGSTTLRSHAGAEVHLSGGDNVRVDVKPAPYVAGDDWGASPKYGGGVASGGASARSAAGRSASEQRSPSPGVSRLQERLRRVQATFAQLRESGNTSGAASSFDTSSGSLRM